MSSVEALQLETAEQGPSDSGSVRHAPVSVCRGDISVPQQIFASSIGALLTSLIVTPMDVVKIRLQSQVRPLAEGECFLFSNGLMDHLCHVCKERLRNGREWARLGNGQQCEWFNRPGHFSGTIDAFVKIARNEGLRSLWSGLSPTMLSAIPATVFYFTLYDNLHCALRERLGNRLYAPLIAGTLARTAAVTVVSPLELVRTKMQSERLAYRDLKLAIRRTVNYDGYSALWRGWWATIIRDIPFSAIYWTFYELTKERLFLRTLPIDTVKQHQFTASFLSGAFAGTIAAILTLPADVVKTHQQITLGQIEGAQRMAGIEIQQQHGGGKRPTNTAAPPAAGGGTFEIARELVRTKGARALFTGIVPRVARVAPACAIMIGCYEHFKSLFARQNREEKNGRR